MNNRKRRGSDSILPLRAAKHPRTTRYHISGGNSTPSQIAGLSARWATLGMEAWKLFRETFVRWAEASTSTSSTSLPSPPPSPTVHPPSPTAHPPSATAPLPSPAVPLPSPAVPLPFPKLLPRPIPPVPPRQLSRPRIPSPFKSPTSAAQPVTPTPASPHASQNGEPPSSSPHIVPPKFQRKSLSRPAVSESGVMSPPTTHDASTSTTPPMSLSSQLPLDAASLSKHVNRHMERSTSRKYKNKEHILAKRHKAQVQEVRKKDREEMERELFEIRRSTGYTSDLESFRSLLSYQARLEILSRREALAPSPSLTDLRAKSPPSPSNRRYSDDVSPAFLKCALEKAKASLQGPKPPIPLSSTFDRLRRFARAKDEEIERRLRGPPLPTSLPLDDEKAVDILLSKRGVVSKCLREQVTDQDLRRLNPHQWLNDEIINFYGQLILARSEESKENPGFNGRKPLNVHYFSTFFWSKLEKDGYEKGRLAKWTKKIDLFQKDIALIPVNHNNSHWTAAAINFRRKRIESYDSMGTERKHVYKLLRAYLDAEHRNKKKKPFDFTGWEDYTLEDIPLQENGYDCGVFTCQFLEALSRGEELFRFRQANMPYLRRRMVWEIGHAKLRDDS
ncbi:hypothetical protein AcV5_004294 [Taiwanofungus camphoratus]|nr:hypothetical protein AcV5_004294 [Antrodia cinnamomea]